VGRNTLIMNSKTLIIIVLLLLVPGGIFGAIYLLKKKSEISEETKKAEEEIQLKKEEEVTKIQEYVEAVEAAMTVSRRTELFDLAAKLYQDMKGINAHKMDYYLLLYNLPEKEFFFLVNQAYPSVDPIGIIARMEKQNWKVVDNNRVGAFVYIPIVAIVDLVFLKDKWTAGAAVELIDKIKKRIRNFKL